MSLSERRVLLEILNDPRRALTTDMIKRATQLMDKHKLANKLARRISFFKGARLRVYQFARQPDDEGDFYLKKLPEGRYVDMTIDSAVVSNPGYDDITITFTNGTGRLCDIPWWHDNAFQAVDEHGFCSRCSFENILATITLPYSQDGVKTLLLDMHDEKSTSAPRNATRSWMFERKTLKHVQHFLNGPPQLQTDYQKHVETESKLDAEAEAEEDEEQAVVANGDFDFGGGGAIGDDQ